MIAAFPNQGNFKYKSAKLSINIEVELMNSLIIKLGKANIEDNLTSKDILREKPQYYLYNINCSIRYKVLTVKEAAPHLIMIKL